ncbi:MAG: hypothetical protein MSS92_09635 [Lachnospiraceae bacterium]|nr:hypothetical protein [Lachnospiraceae bacterium]MCI7596458.1 hypothetical protein [Lachnospiraceae bacterium]MDY3224088.1 hypothetical protein [Lachnospiraceae bacterium]
MYHEEGPYLVQGFLQRNEIPMIVLFEIGILCSKIVCPEKKSVSHRAAGGGVWE